MIFLIYLYTEFKVSSSHSVHLNDSQWRNEDYLYQSTMKTTVVNDASKSTFCSVAKDVMNICPSINLSSQTSQYVISKCPNDRLIGSENKIKNQQNQQQPRNHSNTEPRNSLSVESHDPFIRTLFTKCRQQPLSSYIVHFNSSLHSRVSC